MIDVFHIVLRCYNVLCLLAWQKEDAIFERDCEFSLSRVHNLRLELFKLFGSLAFIVLLIDIIRHALRYKWIININALERVYKGLNLYFHQHLVEVDEYISHLLIQFDLNANCKLIHVIFAQELKLIFLELLFRIFVFKKLHLLLREVKFLCDFNSMLIILKADQHICYKKLIHL